MYVTTINNAKKDFDKVIKHALFEDAVTITSDEENFVLITKDYFESLLHAAKIEANPSFKKRLLDAANEPIENMIRKEDFEW